MRVLLDNDVVLDFLLQRTPFVLEANEIFVLVDDGTIEAYVAGITPVNVFYVSRKIVGIDKAFQLVKDLLDAVYICLVDGNTINTALTLSFKDFEDAVQHTCAVTDGLGAIVTRNTSDFKNATLPVYTPTDFLNQIQSSSN